MATLTDSLLNGLKSLFSGLGAKTTDSNYAVPLVNKSSAEPAGYMEMANLAAVVAGKMIQLNAGDDLDNIKDTGNYNSISSATSNQIGNTPYKGGGFVLYVRPFTQPGKGFVIQKLIGFDTAAVFIRTYTSGAWGQWKSIMLT